MKYFQEDFALNLAIIHFIGLFGENKIDILG
jgi:hypothetical protein